MQVHAKEKGGPKMLIFDQFVVYKHLALYT